MNEKVRTILIGIVILAALLAGAWAIWGGVGLFAVGFPAGAGILGLIIGRAGKRTPTGGIHSASNATDERIDKGFSDLNERMVSLQNELSDVKRRTGALESEYKDVSGRIVEGLKKGEIGFLDDNGNPIRERNNIGLDNSD